MAPVLPLTGTLAVLLGAVALAGCAAPSQPAGTSTFRSEAPVGIGDWSTVASTALDGRFESGPARITVASNGHAKVRWVGGGATVDLSVDRGTLPLLSTTPPKAGAATSARAASSQAAGERSTASAVDGTTVSAWIEDGATPGQARVVAAYGRSPTQLGPPTTLEDRIDGLEQRTIAAAIGDDGKAVVVWASAGQRGGDAVLVATADRSRVFASFQQKLTVDQTVGGVAIAKDGAVVITTVSTSSLDPGQAYAFTRAPLAERFEPQEELPLPGSGSDTYAPAPAIGAPAPTFDSSGRPTIAYVMGASAKTKAQLVVASRVALQPSPPLR